MIDRCGSSLELLADAAQLTDELGGVADGLVCVCDLLKGGNQLLCQVSTAVRTKASVSVRVMSQVCSVIYLHSFSPLCEFNILFLFAVQGVFCQLEAVLSGFCQPEVCLIFILFNTFSVAVED